MEAAERMEESADDITAADTAPRPANTIHLFVHCQNYKAMLSVIYSVNEECLPGRLTNQSNR